MSAVLSISRRRLVRPRLGLAAFVVVGACSSGAADRPVVAQPASVRSTDTRVPVILDYSPTASDAGALLYLTSSDEVDLLAVTLPGTGEADCEPGVRTTRALLALGGRSGTPIGCGARPAIGADRDWPDEWRTNANEWGDAMLPAVADEPVQDAERVLIDAIEASSAPVTVIAVAPLTNLGAVLDAHPELVSRVARVVVMGGAVAVMGNVPAAPRAEWNLYIDPDAARRVLAVGVPVEIVPLDATNDVPWTELLVRRLSVVDTVAARTVLDLAVSRGSSDGFFLWDELTAMAALHPGLVATERMHLGIDDSGALINDLDGFAVEVATAADADAAVDEFVRALNGGRVPEVSTLTAEERGYLTTMRDIDRRFSEELEAVFSAVQSPTAAPRTVATTFVTQFFESASRMAEEVRDVSPPPSLADAHATYVASIDAFVSARDSLLAGLQSAQGADLETLLTDVMQRAGIADAFERIRAACRPLETFAILRDGPIPCTSSAE